IFAAAGAGRLSWRLYPFIITLGFRAVRGWLFVSRGRRRPAGSVLRLRRPIRRIFLRPACSTCTRIIGCTNIFGASLATFVGRYGRPGVLSRVGVDTLVVDGVL